MCLTFLCIQRTPCSHSSHESLTNRSLSASSDPPAHTLHLGISRYAEIFYGLEEVWVAVIGDPADWIDRAPDDRIADSCSYGSNERMKSLLRRLYVPELLRTRSLQADLSFLDSMDPVNTKLILDPNPGTEIRRYIDQHVRKKPHLLVAWIWILYSAILYGGREIQAQRFKAGPEFWDLSGKELKARRTPCPLSFWHIDDASAVKNKFRALILHVDHLLTREEHQDILEESLHIFQKLKLLTLSLDEEAKQVQH